MNLHRGHPRHSRLHLGPVALGRLLISGIAWESPATDAANVLEKLGPPAGRAAPKKTVAP